MVSRMRGVCLLHEDLNRRKLWLFLTVLIFLGVLPGLFAQVEREDVDFEYGERLFDEGLFDLALIQFQQFIKDYPSSPRAVRAQFMTGESAFRLGRFQEAQEAYLRLIIRYPDASFLAQTQYRIGECFEGMGRVGDAVKSYYRVHQLSSESRWAKEGLLRSGQLLLETGSLTEAESTFTSC